MGHAYLYVCAGVCQVIWDNSGSDKALSDSSLSECHTYLRENPILRVLKFFLSLCHGDGDTILSAENTHTSVCIDMCDWAEK